MGDKTVRKGVELKQGLYPRVWVTLEQKIQVKDYEPVSIQAGMAKDVGDDETIQQAFSLAFSEVKKAITPEVRKVIDAKNKRHS